MARLQRRVRGMRGDDQQQVVLFSYRSAEDLIPADHPLRVIRQLVEPNLREISPRFGALYSRYGRPLDTAGAAAVGLVATDSLHDSKPAVADGTARLQSPVAGSSA